MEHNSRASVTLDRSASIPDHDLDWIWPASDTFTDDSISPRILQTCSELGSKRIRLIKILPGRLGDMIKCETRVYFLSQAPEYTAFSYTWGSPMTQCQIIVDKELRQVTTNLWRYLWQARKLRSQFSGWLWIDALSIDQSDPWEKLEQVKIIPDIFKDATKALVWLGPSFGDSDKAMKALATAVPHRSGRSLRFLYAPPLGPAILSLCERAYWRRLWVFQEIKNSRSVDLMCGARHLDLTHLRRFLFPEDVDDRVDVYYKDRLRSSSAADMAKMTHEGLKLSLRSMLDATSHLRCTDPRDRVYANLSTIDSGHQNIEADYTVELSELLNNILRNMHSIEKPKDLETVAKQCSALAGHFGVDGRTIYDVEILWQVFRSFPKCLCHGLAFFHRPPAYQWEEVMAHIWNMHTWCQRYDHRVVAALVRKELVRGLEARERLWKLWKEKADEPVDEPDLVGTEPLQDCKRIIRCFDELSDPACLTGG